jgi:hypothetical protein
VTGYPASSNRSSQRHICRYALADAVGIGQSVRVEYPELERRLGALGASVSDRLQDHQRQSFAELLNAGEYGIALEMVADWLSEDELPITSAERSEAEALAQAMGNVDRVMGPLSLCPE